MEEVNFPGNSREKRVSEPREEKKVEKIITGEVVTRKKPLSRRFREMFVGGDARSVGGYIVMDVLAPALKDLILDIISQGAERMIFGEQRNSRRPGYRPSGLSGHVAYNRYSSPQGRREEARQIGRRARATHDFGEILLGTRTEATDVIDTLFELVSKYNQATVGDLYDLVGIDSTFADQKWGWTDLRGAGVTRTSAGYLLDLPRPEQLD